MGDRPAQYALEGSVAIAGALVQWLRDNLGLIASSGEIETLARTVDDNGGVYFVPAFSGLYAPYWKTTARGVIAGLTRYANKGHIARAALESTAFQTREVVEAMQQDAKIPLEVLRADGGNGGERFADAISSGHSKFAGGATGGEGDDHGAGCGVRSGAGAWVFRGLPRFARRIGRWIIRGNPVMEERKRAEMYALWKRAVTKSFDWVEESRG
jgi:glycerol kinase